MQTPESHCLLRFTNQVVKLRMYLKDIKIYKQGFPVIKKIEKDPNQLTISFLTSFIHTPTFKKLRKELLDEINKEINLNKALYKEIKALYRFVRPILDSYVSLLNLPNNFSMNLFLLVYANSFIDLQEEAYSTVFYINNPAELSKIIEDSEENEFQVGTLVFWQKLSKQQLINWLSENYNEKVLPSMDDTLPSLPFYFDKFRDLEISDFIYSLEKDGSSTSQIIGSLEKEFPDKEEYLHYSWVLNKLNKYKLRIKKYSKLYKIPSDY